MSTFDDAADEAAKQEAAAEERTKQAQTPPTANRKPENFSML